MMKYSGYTKVVEGEGRRKRYVQTWIFKCTECGKEVRKNADTVPGPKPPTHCPKCGR